MRFPVSAFSTLRRSLLAGMLCASVAGFAAAQTKAEPDLQFRGDRFKPLKYGQLDPAQKKMADNLLGGERGGANGPFNVLMRSPEIGDLAQKLGAQVRFHSSLPPKLNELVIIITGRYWTAQYEWYAHRVAAEKAGLSPAIIAAIRDGKRPTGMAAEEEIVYNFASELINTKHVGDATYKAMVDKFGEKGAVDATAVMGYYQLVCGILNLDRYPMPDGVAQELKPLPAGK